MRRILTNRLCEPACCDVNSVHCALSDLAPPWRVPVESIRAVLDTRRKPGNVDEAASRRSQPDGKEMLVEDRQRLLLEKRKSSGIERHRRVPRCTLAGVTPGEPVSDEPLVARGQRGVIAETAVRDRR